MPWFTHDSTDWVDTRDPHVYDGDDWQQVSEALVYDGTDWRLFYVRAIATTVSLTVPTPLEEAITATFTGTVTSGNGVPVGNAVLQINSGGGWEDVSTVALSNGSFTFQWTPPEAGPVDVRAYYPGSGFFTEAYSAETARTVGARAKLSATATAYNKVRLTLTPPIGPDDSYSYYRNGTRFHQGSTNTVIDDPAVSASNTYSYRADIIRSSTVVQQASASATTPARPTASTEVILPTHASGSWNGSNKVRDVNSCYYGYYSSNHGTQKSLVVFNIPAQVRNCIRINYVHVRWYNSHHYKNSGGRVSLVIHHGYWNGSGGSAPADFPGSTQPLLQNGTQVKWPAPKPGWINGTEWFDITNLTSKDRFTAKEEFRVKGAHGLGLVAADGGQAGYGYAVNTPSLKIGYTYYTA